MGVFFVAACVIGGIYVYYAGYSKGHTEGYIKGRLNRAKGDA